MKFGIIMHPTTQNLGDDIQSYAAARLLPQVDYFIDREYIDDFVPEDNEPVAVVMSAWYMWHKWNWPPSKYIIPLLIGMHYSDHQLAKQPGSPIKTEFLSGIGGEYLNTFGPVGCRDKFTEKEFKDRGIDACFSGCITLTLPKMPIVPQEREYICIVDIYDESLEHTKKLLEGTDIELREMTQYIDYREKASTLTWEKRQDRVIKRLTVYQNAKCVITRRLHCALPCLAMGVPVLLLNDEKDGIRFNPYYDWLHYCKRKDYISGKFKYDITNPPPNKDTYLPYREAIIKSVTEFAEKYRDVHGTPEELNPFKRTEDEIIKWRHDVMKSCMNDWLNYTRENTLKFKELNDTLATVTNEKKTAAEYLKLQEELKALKALKSENKEMSKYLSCRSVQLVARLRNLFVGKNKKIDLSKFK